MNRLDQAHTGSLPNPIPYSKSAPQRHGEASFLTLPGDIRNIVYSFLFVEPLVDLDCLMRDWQLPESTPKRKVTGVHLLFTCRQIYNEAASTLYANNTFRLCLFSPRKTKATSDWLRQLGSQCSMLRRIELNVGMQPRNHVACLPLLKTLWYFKVTAEIVVVSDQNREYGYFNSTTLANMNTIMQALINDDLGLRKYGVLLEHINMADWTDVQVKWRGARPQDRPVGTYTWTEFHLDPKEKTLVPKPRGRFDLMIDVPHCIKEAIMGDLVFPDGDENLDQWTKVLRMEVAWRGIWSP